MLYRMRIEKKREPEGSEKMVWKRVVEDLRGGVNRKWVGEIWRGFWWICAKGVCVVLCCGWSESRGPLRRRKEHEPKTPTRFSLSLFFSLCLLLFLFCEYFLFSFWVNFIFVFLQTKYFILWTYVPHFNQRQLERLWVLITCAEVKMRGARRRVSQ